MVHGTSLAGASSVFIWLLTLALSNLVGQGPRTLHELFARAAARLPQLSFHERYKQDRTEEKAWSRPPWTQSEANEIRLTPVV